MVGDDAVAVGLVVVVFLFSSVLTVVSRPICRLETNYTEYAFCFVSPRPPSR